MTALKYNNVLKKVMWPYLLFWYFLKDFVLSTRTQSFMARASGSVFMRGGLSAPSCYLMSKKTRQVKVKGWEAVLKFYVKTFEMKNTHEKLKLPKEKAKSNFYLFCLFLKSNCPSWLYTNCRSSYSEVLEKVFWKIWGNSQGNRAAILKNISRRLLLRFIWESRRDSILF